MFWFIPDTTLLQCLQQYSTSCCCCCCCCCCCSSSSLLAAMVTLTKLMASTFEVPVFCSHTQVFMLLVILGKAYARTWGRWGARRAVGTGLLDRAKVCLAIFALFWPINVFILWIPVSQVSNCVAAALDKPWNPIQAVVAEMLPPSWSICQRLFCTTVLCF